AGELHRDRAEPLLDPPRPQVGPGRAEHAVPVDAVVRPEALVLDRDEGVGDVGWERVERDHDPVHPIELPELVAVTVEQDRGLVRDVPPEPGDVGTPLEAAPGPEDPEHAQTENQEPAPEEEQEPRSYHTPGHLSLGRPRYGTGGRRLHRGRWGKRGTRGGGGRTIYNRAVDAGGIPVRRWERGTRYGAEREYLLTRCCLIAKPVLTNGLSIDPTSRI